jgi:hypothetical protein
MPSIVNTAVISKLFRIRKIIRALAIYNLKNTEAAKYAHTCLWFKCDDSAPRRISVLKSAPRRKKYGNCWCRASVNVSDCNHKL